MYKNRHIGFVGDDDRPIIFPPAEYVARIMPVIPVIKEDYADVSIRNKWD